MSARRRRLTAALALSVLASTATTTLTTGTAQAADAAAVTGGSYDFTTASGAVAAGYTADRGAAYDATRGFGWVTPGTSTPVDMSLNTRLRTGPTDQRQKSLVLMQGSGAASQPNVGAWELSVVNGSYDVTVGVGDNDYLDSTHRVNAEGTAVINGFVATSAARFRTATATVTVSDGKLTLDAIGGTNTKITHVDVKATVTAPADTTGPSVSVTPSGSSNGSGGFFDSVTFTVSASDPSGVASRTLSVDGGAPVTYTAPVTVSGAGTHTATATATDTAGNTSTSPTASATVTASPPGGNGVLAIENTDGVPYDDRVVLSRIQTPEDGTKLKADGTCCVPVNRVHDRTTLRLRNTGTGALRISALSVPAGFTAVPATPLPAVVAAGGALDVLVTFVATSGGLVEGDLVISSDQAGRPTATAQLAGFWQTISEGGKEPTLASMVKGFGYTTTVLDAGQVYNQKGAVATIGDEVLSGYWLRSDATKPVSVRQLVAYHTQGNTATFRWYLKSTPTTRNTLFTHAGVDGQSVLPLKDGSTAPAAGTFSPSATAPFGLRIDAENSVDSMNDQTKDSGNGCAGPCGHHMRFFPAFDRSGKVITDTWIVVMDYAAINYDYQDNVYLVSNMRPETAVSPSTPAVLPGALGTARDFEAPVAGTLPDASGQGTGFASVQRNKLDTVTTSSSSQPSRLTLSGGALNVLAYGTSTAGSSNATDNTQVNALQNPFDASLEPFTLTTRVNGPLDAYTVGAVGTRQAGLHFGPNQDDTVRLHVVVRNGAPYVQLNRDVAGVLTTVATSTSPLPTASGAVDLLLIGDPRTGTLSAAYRLVNGGTPGALVALGASTTLPAAKAGRFFARQARAGIYASAKGSTEFTASFDSFAILPDDVRAPDGPVIGRWDIGSTTDTTDVLGNTWKADTGLFTPSTAPAEGASVQPQAIDNTENDLLERTYRALTNEPVQANRVFSYALPVGTTGPVRLRMHFVERFVNNSTTGKRVYSIQVEGRTITPDFDLFAAAGGQNRLVTLTVPDLTVSGALDIRFAASKDYGALNAVEVLTEGATPPPEDTTPPPVPASVTATAGSSSIAVGWSAVSAPDLAGYLVYRSTSTPVATTGTPLSGSTPLTGTSFTDTTAVPGTAYSYVVVSQDTTGNRSAASSPATATVPVGSPLTAKIDFSDAATAPAAGYVRDSGGAFGPRAGLPDAGWVADGTATPLSLATNGRVRTTGTTTTDARLLSFLHMQYTGNAANGSSAVGAYELAVPNGTYAVTVALGDAGAYYDSTHRVSVEGQATVGPLTPTSATRFVTGSATVQVSDGRLTIRPTGTNTKIAYLDVAQQAVAPDSTAPAAPTGLSSSGGQSGIVLGWSASPEPDLAGYALYRSTSLPVGTSGAPVSGSDLLTGTAFTDTTAAPGTTYSYAVVAVDTAGNRSPGSAPSSAAMPVPDTTPPPTPTQVTATVVGNGIQVGWSAVDDDAPAGYLVYRSTTTPVPTTGTPLSGTSPLTATSFTDATPAPGAAYSYVVLAVDSIGNRSAASAPASAGLPAVALRVDFSDAATAPASGYVRDSGAPYGPSADGSTRGWVRLGTSMPLDLSANGRLRSTGTTTTDARQLSFLHMQYPAEASGPGSSVPGSWELAVPTGTYAVTVGVGDAGKYYDSDHQVNVEDQNAVAGFVPTSTTRLRALTRTVRVTDGRLTLSPQGGTNTKITYVDVTSVAPEPARPRVQTASPANLAVVSPDSLSVSTTLALVGSGVASGTVSSASVKLTDVTSGSTIPANVNTSGGGDTLILTPNSTLASNATYRFDVTSGVTDTDGLAFQPWSSVFRTTASSGESGIAGVAFTKQATPATGGSYTSVTVGPDHRLYAGSLDGYVHRFPIAADGSLGTPTVISTVRDLHAGASRTVIGLAFDPSSTAAAPVLWVTDNAPYLGVNDVPDWQGQVVRLTGPDLGTGTVVVTGLPRSNRDHETNSAQFGPDGALYVNQGSNTAMGAPDAAWGNRPERTLSASVLRLDLGLLPSTLPLNVKTQEGGTYNPFAAGAPLTIYASGVRNAYDLVWHSNGNLYVPTNGSAANGNTPATPATLPASCSTRVDAATSGGYTGPAVPGLAPNPEDEPDWVFRIRAGGGYYGHPNPQRCEWAMNGANPTAGADPFQVGAYPTGTAPDRNYRSEDVYDIGLHASANGVIEYRSGVFGSKLQGKLIVVRYSAGQDLVVLDPSGPQGAIVSKTLRVEGFTGFSDPLDVTEDVATGSIYVTELGTGSITQLTPVTA